MNAFQFSYPQYENGIVLNQEPTKAAGTLWRCLFFLCMLQGCSPLCILHLLIARGCCWHSSATISPRSSCTGEDCSPNCPFCGGSDWEAIVSYRWKVQWSSSPVAHGLWWWRRSFHVCSISGFYLFTICPNTFLLPWKCGGINLPVFYLFLNNG